MGSETDVLVTVGAADEESDEYVADLASDLREALEEHPQARVSYARGGAAPPGARGAALEWATLAVAFGGNLPGMVSLIQGWLTRKPHDSHVEIAVGEHKLVLRHAPLDVQRAAIEEFYARVGQET